MLDIENIRYKARAQGGHKYWVQWVTATNRYGEMFILGYCVRDMDTFNGDTVFKHESKIVCEKVAKLLNEGVRYE